LHECDLACSAHYPLAAHDPKESGAMYYFFRRGAVSIRCEVRPDAGGEGYELVIDRPDSAIRVERFNGPRELNQRWADLQRALTREGWGGPHARGV
jgi:hypothetical protein